MQFKFFKNLLLILRSILAMMFRRITPSTNRYHNQQNRGNTANRRHEELKNLLLLYNGKVVKKNGARSSCI